MSESHRKPCSKGDGPDGNPYSWDAFLVFSGRSIKLLANRISALLMNAFFNQSANSFVTLTTRIGNVSSVQARAFIGRVIDAVGAMAISTHGCNHQTGFEESLSMNGHSITCQIFCVTAATCLDLLIQIDGRSTVLHWQHTVRLGAMAFAATK